MPGPPPPPGVRFGANTYAGFGNPALEGARGTGGGAAGGGFRGRRRDARLEVADGLVRVDDQDTDGRDDESGEGLAQRRAQVHGG